MAILRVISPKVFCIFHKQPSVTLFFQQFFYVWGSNNLSSATLVWTLFETLLINWKGMLPHLKGKKISCWLFSSWLFINVTRSSAQSSSAEFFALLDSAKNRIPLSPESPCSGKSSGPTAKSHHVSSDKCQIQRFTVENWSLPTSNSTQLVCYRLCYSCDCLLRFLLSVHTVLWLVALLWTAGSPWRLVFFLALLATCSTIGD